MEDLVERLNNLTPLELVSLTKKLETEWGVKAAPPVQKVSEPKFVQRPEAELAQTEFNVTLVSYPLDKKVAIIKTLREVLTMGLKEAKEFIEAAPKMLREAVSKEEAESIRARMAEAGAVIEVK